MWLTVLGALLVVAVLVDLGWTTLAPAAGKGPLTRAVGRLTWRATARSWSHTARQARGYVVLVGVLLAWVAGTWFGWSLVFLGADGAVVDSSTGDAWALPRVP